MTDQGKESLVAARERFCIHHRKQPPGTSYSGMEYVAALQRLKVAAAMQAASNVEAFFWKDAPGVTVWLCHECAGTLTLRTEPAS